MSEPCIIVKDPDTGKLRCFIRDGDLNRWLANQRQKVRFD